MAVKAGMKPAKAAKKATRRVAAKATTPHKAVRPSAKKPRVRRAPSKSASESKVTPASRLIDARIKQLADWRGTMLARLRDLIRAADPEVIEEFKWRQVPVWSHDGMICTGETYKSVVKLTFFKGAQLEDPAKLFNSSLEGNTRRAIDFYENDAVDETSFKNLIRSAIALNRSVAAGRASRR